jgi:hypothetical protein
MSHVRIALEYPYMCVSLVWEGHSGAYIIPENDGVGEVEQKVLFDRRAGS